MWLTLAGAILVEVFATMSLRASDGFRDKKWIAPVVVGYIAACKPPRFAPVYVTRVAPVESAVMEGLVA